MNDDAVVARRYLLGLGEDADAVEDRLLRDDGFAALVEAVERELYDAYAADELSREERRQFQKYVDAHPDSAARLRFSRALAAAGGSRGRRRYAGYAAAVAAIAAALVLVAVLRGPSPAPPPQKPVEVYALVLQPGTLRSGGGERQAPQIARIPVTAAEVSIELAGAQASTARIVFVDTDKEVWRGPVSGGRVRAPVGVLAPGDHVITTFGSNGEELADYVFRVVR